MAQEKFEIGQAVSFGWDVMKNNIGYFIVVLLIAWVAQGIPSSLSSALGYRNVGLAIILSLISLVVGIFVSMAYIKISLRLCDGDGPEYTDLYSAYPFFWKYLLGSILYGLIVLGGLILLIVPGIIWGIKYYFFGYLIIDQGMGPVEAIKKSGEMTMGSKADLFVFFLAALGIMILGLLACVVGLFAAFPTVIVATAYIYRSLLAAPAAQQATPVPQAPQA